MAQPRSMAAGGRGSRAASRRAKQGTRDRQAPDRRNRRGVPPSSRTLPVPAPPEGAAPEEAAKAAGLRYTPDTGPGIKRRRAGKGFRYVRPGGRPASAADAARAKALAIPPAWREVWINPDPKGHIQATGRDARGRKQYRYHPDWRALREETKFEHAIAFAEALPRIRARVRADLSRSGMPREKTLAAVVRLLERTLIRVGNAEYARANDSYGLTTMVDDHATFEGSAVRFSFRGKSGKEHEVGVRDRSLAGIVRRMQDLPGEPLFQYLDGDTPRPIGSGDVNAYLREITGEPFTAKDFRTWAATTLAAQRLRRLGSAETKRALVANVNRALDEVAGRLGNTRAVCRASYVHPAVLSGYEDGALVAFECGPCGIDGLDEDEWFALAWLRQARDG